jgi:hypothetical protein
VDLSRVGTGRVAENVALTMATYFGNIDRRRFGLAHSAEPSLGTTAGLARGDAYSHDSAVVVHDLRGGAGRPVATVSFRSSQPASEGIDGESCTVWQNEYQLVSSGESHPPYVFSHEIYSSHHSC